MAPIFKLPLESQMLTRHIQDICLWLCRGHFLRIDQWKEIVFEISHSLSLLQTAVNILSVHSCWCLTSCNCVAQCLSKWQIRARQVTNRNAIRKCLYFCLASIKYTTFCLGEGSSAINSKSIFNWTISLQAQWILHENCPCVSKSVPRIKWLRHTDRA